MRKSFRQLWKISSTFYLISSHSISVHRRRQTKITKKRFRLFPQSSLSWELFPVQWASDWRSSFRLLEICADAHGEKMAKGEKMLRTERRRVGEMKCDSCEPRKLLQNSKIFQISEWKISNFVPHFPFATIRFTTTRSLFVMLISLCKIFTLYVASC